MADSLSARRPGGAVSVVIPARDEAGVIAQAIAAASRAVEGAEILVVDNASSDGTARVAARAGARVVFEGRVGYGSALRRGLREARGDLVVIADADGTYPLDHLGALLAPLHQGRADLVTGTRLRGRLHPGAMPFLHRYIGVPFLTFLVNLLFGLRLSDGHCGMRAFTRRALEVIAPEAPGMEFATEVLIRAARSGLRIVEVPIEYRPRPPGSISKLRTLPDGWRHVRLILREYLRTRPRLPVLPPAPQPLAAPGDSRQG